MPSTYPPDVVAKFLARLPLFEKCSGGELASLARKLPQRGFDTGELLLKPGEKPTGIGLLLSGRAKLMLTDAVRGVDAHVEGLRQGNLFGEVGLFLGRGTPLSVVAVEPCRALFIERHRLAPMFRRDPELGLMLAQQVSLRFLNVCTLGLRATAAPAAPAEDPAPAPRPEPRPAQESLVPEEESLRWVDLGAYTITPELLDLVPSQLIQRHRLMPLAVRGRRLLVGMVNPRSVTAQQDLRRVLHSLDPELVAVSADDFNRAFVRLKLDPGDGGREQRGLGHAPAISYTATQERGSEKGKLIIGDEVIALVDRIIGEAVERGASDIHIEPDATGVRVRYRVSGVLGDRAEFLGHSYAAPIIGRIKVLAELDITEHRLPQDGRISARLGRRELNLRVSTMAVARGEKAVIRLVDPGDVMRPLGRIFVDPALAKRVKQAVGEPYGAVLVAGPTGSGKSSTLYSMLNERHLTRPDNNIVTVEDPVEFLMQGVTQVSVNERTGVGFATVLRGLMRQDPDVIMIGELRDGETAGIMVEAALTGHLVLSSTHGNNAAAVLQRLAHFGLDQVILSQALSMIVVQRLVGRLCPACVSEAEVAPAMVENLVARKVLAPGGAAVRLPRPQGCESCGGSGYVGRVAVQEVLHLDEGLAAMLAAGRPTAEILAEAKERGRFVPFAATAAYLMARRMLAPADAMLIVSD